MIFKVRDSSLNDKFFSWRLSKNPESEPFKREFGNGRIVHGHYSKHDQEYIVFIENDELTAIKKAKEENRFSYLGLDIYDVTLENLAGIKEVFRSLLSAKFSGIPDDEIHKAYEYRIEVGPIEYNGDWLKSFVSKLNIEIIIYNIGTNLYEYVFYAELPLYEFVQKVYVLLYAFCNEYVKDEQRLESLNYPWLNELESEDKQYLVSKLLKTSTKYVNTIKNAEIFGIEDTDDELKENYHQMRLRATREIIDKLSCKTIIDLGSGTGQLFKDMVNLDKYNIIGIEIDKRKVNKARKRFDFIRHGNILNLNLKESELKPDIVTLIEVIEHFDEKDRKTLLHNIRDIIQPKYIFITTPNIEYNSHFNLQDGQLRHKDHKIEYTKDLFREEIYDYFQNKYVGMIHSINDDNGEPVSWILLLERNPNEPYLTPKLNNFDSFRLNHSDYFITSKQVYSGMCDNAYIKNIDNIFYLGSTIAPVEYNPVYGNTLENINSAIQYYLNKNICDISIEEKQMGSRAYILVFRTQELAEKMGYKNKIIINSRNGYPFFSEEQQNILEDIHADLYNENNVNVTDVMMFDAEITPWTLKAEKMIEREFERPLMKILYHGLDVIGMKHYNALKAYNNLNVYSKQDNIKVHIFQTLFTANVNQRLHYIDATNHLYSTSYNNFEDNLQDGKYIRKINRYNLHLTKEDSTISNIVELVYDSFVSKKLEGAVVKPLPKFNIRNNGKLIQPALKVRNSEYLRLIYGPNYMEPELFPMIANRNIKSKRSQAVTEFELSLNMISAFAKRDKQLLNQYIAGFLAIQDGIWKVDATL